MKAYLILFAILFANPSVRAQVTMETGHSGSTKDGALIVYGSDNLQQAIPYEKIKGSPYWQNNWTKAFLFDQRDTALGIYKARFNFATHELHYFDKKGEEKVVIPGMLNAVIFMREDDSTKIASVFRANIPEIKLKASCKKCFAQELNQGDVKLLKITQRQLKSGDSLFGTLKRYYFADAAEYFVHSGSQYHKIKRLNKEAVLAFVTGASAYEEWIRKKNLRFNKESDYILFFDHYNITHKKE
jgi:hypothetical protein